MTWTGTLKKAIQFCNVNLCASFNAIQFMVFKKKLKHNNYNTEVLDILKFNQFRYFLFFLDVFSKNVLYIYKYKQLLRKCIANENIPPTWNLRKTYNLELKQIIHIISIPILLQVGKELHAGPSSHTIWVVPSRVKPSSHSMQAISPYVVPLGVIAEPFPGAGSPQSEQNIHKTLLYKHHIITRNCHSISLDCKRGIVRILLLIQLIRMAQLRSQ